MNVFRVSHFPDIGLDWARVKGNNAVGNTGKLCRLWYTSYGELLTDCGEWGGKRGMQQAGVVSLPTPGIHEPTPAQTTPPEPCGGGEGRLKARALIDMEYEDDSWRSRRSIEKPCPLGMGLGRVGQVPRSVSAQWWDDTGTDMESG